jgi:uncharacterized protein with PQ loop repeat
MTLHDLAIGSGYLGALLSVGMVVPQLVRTARHPQTGGVSVLSWTLTMTTCLTWLAFGVRAGATPQIPGNVLIIPGAAAIALTAPSRLTVRRRAATLGAAAAAVLAAALVLPPDGIGYLAFLIGLASAAPQAIASVRRSSAAGGSAVSVPAWLLRGGSQVFWLAYAVVLRDVPVMVAAVVTLLSALVLVAAESRRSRPPEVAAIAAPTAMAGCGPEGR